MSEPIVYTITFEEGHWVARDPSKRVRGVAVALSLTQMERELNQAHVWAWPDDTPAVELSFDLPEELSDLVSEYQREKRLAEAHTRKAAELARRAATALTGLWSEPDTARILGISKQRVHQLKVG
ncbi:hypothetical protein [Nonomuraea sediminis]|uniref:hypothetical protein n=1 Tax=Nonomuraea sediminis TaxID=2835864 RepID=UPI001BDD616F|nr:hypothetical protein [Nonomuraea sediminis]